MHRFSILLVGIFGFISFSHAADPVAPLVPEIVPPKAVEIVEQFHQALSDGFQAGGLILAEVKIIQRQLHSSTPVEGCFVGACLEKVISVVKAPLLGTTRVDAMDKNYVIEVRLYHRNGNQLIDKLSGRCDICTLKEATQTTQKLAEQLATQYRQSSEKRLSAPTVSENPGGAPAVIPPKDVPSTPVAASPVSNKSLVAQNSQASLYQETKAPTQWPLWPSIVAVGTGVLGMAIGIPLLAIDGKGTGCIGDARPDKKNCEYIYNTGAGGISLMTIGLGALTASGIFFYLHVRSKRPASQLQSGRPILEQITIDPAVQGGVSFSARGRF